MQALLQRQGKILERLETIAKQDRLLQLIQTKELYEVDKDSDRLEVQLKKLNETVKKGLIENTGNSLNSNVSKLVKAVSSVNGLRSLNKEEVRGITDKAMERRQFNTVRPRVDNLKDNVKDFFTARGFLDKTGIVKRGSGGIISEYLDRAEDKKKYINNRLKMDPTARLHGEEGARKIFSAQYDKQQDLQYNISRNEKQLKEYRDQGFTEDQIARSKESKNSSLYATELAKVDPRLRPQGFDTKTGLVKDKEGLTKSSNKGESTEETMLEQNRMVEDQTELLKKIEENTRPTRNETNSTQSKAPEPVNDSDSGFGLGGIGKGIKSIGGKYLGKVGGIGKLAKGVGIGALGSLAGGLAESGGQALQAAGYEQTGKAVSTLGSAASYAGTGAMMGSFIPGIGTAIGAGIGGLVGLGKGIYDNYFSGGNSSEESGNAGNASGSLAEKYKSENKMPVSIQNEDGSTRLIGYQVPGEGFVPLPETTESDIKKYQEARGQIKGALQARAEGGPVEAGSAYVVGENGPEIIIPSSDGEVMSNEKLKELGEIRAKRKIFSGNNDLVEMGKYTSPEAQAELDKMAARDEKLTSELTAQGIDVNSALAYTGGATESDLMTELLAPTSGDALSKASADNEAAKLQSMRANSGNNIVSAPTVNNVNNSTNVIKSPIRNQDSSLSNYVQSRYVAA